MGGIQGGIKPTYCFEAGTPVVTENGAVAIEDITVGDRVLSYDYVTGEQSYQTVTATSIRQTNELIALSVCGEQIVTTPRHPFYMVNDDTYHGYTAAEYLSAGDCILTADGDYAVIESVEKQLLAEPIDVYNFTVENNHSYYVGETELLVHNAGGCTVDPNGAKQFRNSKSLYNHYGKHVNARGEFGNITVSEYLSKAQNLANSPQYLVKTMANGEKVFYNSAANEFLKLSNDGFIKTFFRPDDGIQYLIDLGYL